MPWVCHADHEGGLRKLISIMIGTMIINDLKFKFGEWFATIDSLVDLADFGCVDQLNSAIFLLHSWIC